MQPLSILGRRLAGSLLPQAACAQCAVSTFSTSAFVAFPPQSAAVCDVPAGHEKSDLRNNICNISLNRRRDISLRSDVKFHNTRDDEPVNLRQLLRAKKLDEGGVSVLFGVPDMGKLCTEKHAPGFIEQAAKLNKLGVTQIFAVGVGPPAQIKEWGDKVGLNQGKICAIADKNGSFARLLGVEMNPADADPPHCHRYAALVENGILIKLRVEDDNGDVDKASAEAIVKLLEDAADRKEAAKGKHQQAEDIMDKEAA